MQAGDLRTKIRIQKPISTGTGSFATISWIDVDNTLITDSAKYIYSSWVNVHGSEAWIANSVQAQLGATVTIRYRSDIKNNYRVLLGDVIYQIVSLDNIRQTGQWLEIKVKAAVNG